MEYFLDVVETVPEGVGFQQFQLLHICWLAAFVGLTAVCAVLYRRWDASCRKNWRMVMAFLVVLDEVIKQVLLFSTGAWIPDYLPLHLCSINIFLMAFHAFRPNNTLGNFLYMVCVPGAIAALLFPSWTELPGWNVMCIHSFTVHILLAMYPLVLAIGGDIRPTARQIPQCLGILAIMAAVIYGANLFFKTNFFFLMSADPGNPLYLFETMWGSHLLGFPVIIAGVLIVMFLPVELYRMAKAKKQKV